MNKIKSILFKLGLAKFPTTLKTRHANALTRISELEAELSLTKASEAKPKSKKRTKKTK